MIFTRIVQAMMFMVIAGIAIGFVVEWYKSKPLTDHQRLQAENKRRDDIRKATR